MAIYHFSGQVISRGQGRSSIAAAAYRSAEKIYDERTELTHNFTKKEHDLLHKEILLPEGAPEKFKDRDTLWNEVERTEKRKDAQLCREFNVALPKKLTTEQNIKLIQEFTKQEFADRGMIADICIHKGHNKGEDKPHAHIMLTQREVTSDGFGQKNRDWNSKELMLDWREAWAETANKHLFLNGHDIAIDHRTLEEQGINLEPQSKIGPTAAKEHMARLEEHQRIARENGERILKSPKIALDAITRQQSTFTQKDLAQFVNRHTVDREQFTAVYEKLKANTEIVELGLDAKGQERYTTQEMLEIEKRMLNYAENCKAHGFEKNNSLINVVSRKLGLTQDQQAAYEHVVGDNGIACITGFAGSGKSHVLKAANEVWQKKHNVIGMTLSGIAAENLESGAGIKSYTVANRLINWENDRERLTNKDIVVIDEAGMLGSRQVEKILAEAHKAQAKVVMVGDPEQLQAIEAGAAYRAISDKVGSINLTDIKRQKELWQQGATKNFATRKTELGLRKYAIREHVHYFRTKNEAMEAMIERWDETRSNQPDKTLVMLAYTRSDVKELNEQARDIRQKNGELGASQKFNCSRGVMEFAEGDRIYFLKNDKELGVKNGTLGAIEKIHNNTFTIKADGKDKVSFNINDYNHIDHGYAATVHKAQGVTVDRSYVLASKYFDRHVTYVAMTRHREGVELFYNRDDFPSYKNLEQTLSKERTKDISLDYIDSRGIETPGQIKSQQYKAYDIGQDRLKAAEERLIQRGDEKRMAKEIKALEHHIGRKVSMEIEDGEKGIFRGVARLDGKRFGMLEQEDMSVKLVGYEYCHGLDNGNLAIVTIEDGKKHFDVREVAEEKQEKQPELQKELQKEKSLEMELEL